jgi:hypothetical protein
MPHYRVPSLSGVFAEAVDQGYLDLSTKGLDALAERLRGRPEGFVSIDNRLEEARWPLRNDVALARFAARAYPLLPERLEPTMKLVERWLAGEAISVAELRVGWQSAHAIHWGSSWAEHSRAESEDLYRRIHEDIAPEALAELDRTFGDPVADVQATEMVTMVASAAYGASEGWLSFYAHRRLSSPVASSAVRAITIAVSARGKDLWNAIIDEALRLPLDPADPVPAADEGVQ